MKRHALISTLSEEARQAAQALRRVPTVWRVIFSISAVLWLLILAAHFFFMPQLQAWLAAEFPEATAIQKDLEDQFPKRAVSVNDQTFYNIDNDPDGDSKKRLFSVIIIGRNHVSADEAKQVQHIICTRLGEKAGHYDRILLQSTIEKRYLVLFFTRDNKKGLLGCTPSQLNEIKQAGQPKTQPPSQPPPNPIETQPLPDQPQPNPTVLHRPEGPAYEGTCCQLQDDGYIITELE